MWSGRFPRTRLTSEPALWDTEFLNTPPVLDHLAALHSHSRDPDLTFDPASHVYRWQGQPVPVSVTGLIHSFSRPFHSLAVIRAMREGSNWPRAGYIVQYASLDLLAAMASNPGTEALRAQLQALPLDEEAVVLQLLAERADGASVLAMITLSDADILQKWASARRCGAARGTWMHAQVECLLNGGIVSSRSIESIFFLHFVRDHLLARGLQVYRTEWRVYATEEALAGCIDCAARRRDGELVLFDWKRTKHLVSKARAFGRVMLPPFQHIPDSAWWHYRLQLNLYAAILERYYQQLVVGLHVVCMHPEEGLQVFDVPRLPRETNALLEAARARRWQDQLGGTLPVWAWSEVVSFLATASALRSLRLSSKEVGAVVLCPQNWRGLSLDFRSVGLRGWRKLLPALALWQESAAVSVPYWGLADTLTVLPFATFQWTGRFISAAPLCFVWASQQPLFGEACFSFDLQSHLRELVVGFCSPLGAGWFRAHAPFSPRACVAFHTGNAQDAVCNFLDLPSKFQQSPITPCSVCLRWGAEGAALLLGDASVKVKAEFLAQPPHPCGKVFVTGRLGVRGTSPVISPTLSHVPQHGATVCHLCRRSAVVTSRLMEACRGCGSWFCLNHSFLVRKSCGHCRRTCVAADVHGGACQGARAQTVRSGSHAFISPIWFDEQELRRQVQQFAEATNRTAQVAFESAQQRTGWSLFGENSSAQCLVGRRRPYGYIIRALELSGWKRVSLSNRLESCNLGACVAVDVQGGAADASQESGLPGIGELPANEEDNVAGVATPDSEQAQLHSSQEEPPCPRDLQLEACKKRRLLPGAGESARLFAETFEEQRRLANEALRNIRPARAESRSYSILSQTQHVLAEMLQLQPTWSEQLRRLVATACVLPRVRLADAYVREHILFIWLMQGGRYIRSHSGQCYLYHEAGAFQVYRGCPHEQTVARLKEFLLQLEGFLRELPTDVRPDLPSLAGAAQRMMEVHGGDVDRFLDALCDAGVRSCEAAGRPRIEAARLPGAGAEEAPREIHTDKSWADHCAAAMLKLSQNLQREIMNEQIYRLINEWCETPRKQQPGCAYLDTCARYDRSCSVELCSPHPDNNIYLLIPHALKPALPDPFLQEATARLDKFLKQTFWANTDVFLCCQAAQALAKRGENIDRCFIGQSPGGVGQSLYSAHLNAVYGQNHAYIDPNIWFDDQELRKQVEQFAHAMILTAQEAPETTRKMREDLYKKTMSADGIAGRRPYGYITRMIELVGWKRMEVNRFMPFKGVSEHNFPSILRRSFVWLAKARFVAACFLADHYPDSHLDGYFPKDPSLKEFLVSGPAIAASLVLQHGFEMKFGREQCLSLIENYAGLGGDAGLTEDKMRAACSLQARARTETIAPGLLPEADSEHGENLRAQCASVQKSIIDYCWQKGIFACTKSMFINHVKLPADAPNLDRETMWSKLLESGLLQALSRRGKGKDHAIPLVVEPAEILLLFPLKERRQLPFSFPELWHLGQVKAYATSHGSRENNVVVLSACVDALTSRQSKHGRRTRAEEQELDNIKGLRRSIDKCEETIGQLLQAALDFEAVTSSPSTRRSRKEPPTLTRTVRYTYGAAQDCVRGRQFATSTGAQKCPRRLLPFLCPDTVDLDIENAFFTVMSQFLRKLPCDAQEHDTVCCLLEQCAQGRTQLIQESLRLPLGEGKQVLLEVAHGSVPPLSLNRCKLLRDLQDASTYLKWVATGVLPELHDVFVRDIAKKNPENSVLAHLYQALEDIIMCAWVEHLTTLDLAHLSLHFDGVRLVPPSHVSVDDICEASMTHIAQATGFNLRIRPKSHGFLRDLLFSQAVTVGALQPASPSYEAVGNGIPAALAFCFQDGERVLRWLRESNSENVNAKRFGVRSYRACAAQLKRALLGRLEYRPPAAGRVILHTEDRGRAHAIPCVYNNDGPCQLLLGTQIVELSAGHIANVVETCVDRKTMVFFHCYASQDEIPPEGAEACFGDLLDLQAGSSEDDSEDLPLSESEGEYASCGEEGEDDDGAPVTVTVGDTLLALLKQEKDAVATSCTFPSHGRKFRCPLCPFRAFQSPERVRVHVRTYHNARCQHCCSGTKQLRCALALFDHDQIMGGGLRASYLRRSAEHIRASAGFPVSETQTSVDRHLRLVLSGTGPRFVGVSAVHGDLRRARNLYYDHAFADMVFQETLTAGARMKTVSWLDLIGSTQVGCELVAARLTNA